MPPTVEESPISEDQDDASEGEIQDNSVLKESHECEDSDETSSEIEDDVETEYFSEEDCDISLEGEQEIGSTENRDYITNQTLVDTEMLLHDLTIVENTHDEITSKPAPTPRHIQLSDISSQPASVSGETELKSPTLEPQAANPIIVIDDDTTTMNTDAFTISSTISPANIPETNESEFFIQESDGTGFTCTLCDYKSTSKGGIKNHLTRTHKIQKTLMHPPKNFCKKCKKEVKNVLDAGQCVQCGGYEHYRCTQSGKQHKT